MDRGRGLFFSIARCLAAVGHMQQKGLLKLLIQLADGAGRYPSSPQRLGDIFHRADAHSNEGHLHQRLLNRRLPPSITLDDLRLKRLAPQPRDLERYLARLRLQLTLVRAGPRVDAIGRSFVALGPADRSASLSRCCETPRPHDRESSTRRPESRFLIHSPSWQSPSLVGVGI